MRRVTIPGDSGAAARRLAGALSLLRDLREIDAVD